jgi:hypothetical protein
VEKIQISVERVPDPEDRKRIIRKLVAFNELKAGTHELGRPFDHRPAGRTRHGWGLVGYTQEIIAVSFCVKTRASRRPGNAIRTLSFVTHTVVDEEETGWIVFRLYLP